MNNPGHFLTLKENFPLVDSKPVDDTISKVFFERALIQKSVSFIIKDLYMSFCYDKGRFFNLLRNYFVRIVKQSLK
jgi:hypothetical protein